ncbi:MAG: ASCH domain-containing protein [Cyanobacteria bacterium P01_F01_bin.150]
MSVEVLLVSIHPKYVEKIFHGDKKVELRRQKPRVDRGDLMIIYSSSPDKVLKGFAKVEKVIQKPVLELWRDVRGCSGISYSEFRSYYKGTRLGCGIFLSHVYLFDYPVSLTEIRKSWVGFHPPQNYRYLKNIEIELVGKLINLDLIPFFDTYQLSLNSISPL